MSKLAKAITATTTGNVRVARDRLRYLEVTKSVSDVGSSFSPHKLAKEYRIEARFTAVAWLEDEISKTAEQNHDAFQEMLQTGKRGMIEEMFGEFRPLIIEMRVALYDEDTQRVRTLLAQLEEQMFTDGVE